MKPLLTRAFARNVLAAAGIAALCCGLTGFAASTAAASTAAASTAAASMAPRTVAGRGVFPSSRMFPWNPSVDLMVTVQQTATSPVDRWTLTCDPTGGSLPDPVRACARLSEVRLPPSAPPVHIMCPMIIYGPEFVAIEGWWHGSWISLRLDRTDAGCEAASWNGLITALGLSGPIYSGGPMTR